MKNELGIEVCCENCHNKQYNMCVSEFGIKCKAEGMKCFITSDKAYKARIKELQEQQFTGIEASTVLFYMKQANLIIKNENASIPNIESIFSKLEKIKGKNNEQ